MAQQETRAREGTLPHIRMSLCTTDTEWTFAKAYRQKYFFDKQPIKDPYTWTFEHKDHKHFVLYNGTELVGYAHIQLWPKNRSAIRIIVIDHTQRNLSFGAQFMALLEEWLKSKDYISIHVEASPEALKFYVKRGYTEMPFEDPDGYEGGKDDTEIGKVL